MAPTLVLPASGHAKAYPVTVRLSARATRHSSGNFGRRRRCRMRKARAGYSGRGRRRRQMSGAIRPGWLVAGYHGTRRIISIPEFVGED
jgi:hypothetical protein